MNILKNKLISAKHTFAVIFVFTSMVLVGVLGTLAISSVQDVFAAINKQINYQGKLTNTSGAAVSDGTYNMEFKLYTVSSGGSPLWTETRTSGDKVQVTNGLFSVLLGEVTSLSGVDFNQTIYLGVNIGGTSTPSWDGEMTPRKKLGAVPAAIVAETLNGLYSSQFFRNDATNATSSAQAFFRIQQSGAGAIAEFIGSASTTSMIIKADGKIGIGTTTPTEKLELVNGIFKVSNGGKGVSVGDALIGDEAGLYSANASEQIATFDFGNNQYTYGDGVLNVRSSNVGIGTTTPSSILSVAGDFNLTGALRTNGSAGTSGQLLQTTGSGLTWVSTSTLAADLNYLRVENGGLSTATSTDFLKAAYFSATSTTGTSTFAGAVGIGTIGPGAQVHIANDSLNPTLRISTISSTGFDPTLELYRGDGTSIGGKLWLDNSTGDMYLDNIWNNNAGDIYFRTKTLGTPVNALSILGTGNVGIGTTTPSSILSVAGDFNLTGALRASGDAGTTGMILQTTGTGVQWVATSSLGISGGGGSGTVTSGLIGQVAFYNANGTTVVGTSTLFITGENVGVGTTTPSSKLVVVGTSTMDYLVVGGGTPLTNSIAHFGSNVNSFAQVNVQNRNAGASASSDFVATADDGNDSRYYIDFGINSSGYNNPSYSITSARDGYLYTSDGALAIGTGSSTNANAVLKFHTGGTQAANERMRITATGDVGIGTSSPMTDLDVFGSMVLSALNSYLNFGNATGTVGYGFRDNAGTIQIKNSGGSWVNIPTSGTTQWTDSGSDIFFNTGNVGIGTSSPAEKLQVAGNILIGKRTDSAGVWTLKSQSTPGTIASGGTASIGTTTAMAVYNGSLYVGTMKAGAAEIYRHDGGTSWTKVSSSTAGVISEDAGATSAINSVSSMAVYNGLLYVGTAKTGGAEVYQYNGNSTWTLISSTTAGAIGGNATTTAIDAISSMVVHQGQLIIGTSKASAAEIYRYDVGQNANAQQRWFKLTSANAGTIGATTAVSGVTALLSHNGFLYVGVTKANGADVYRMDAPMPTNTFTRINAAAGSFTVATALDNVRTLAVFNGSIFAGVDDGAGTARVVRWNGNYTAGTVWSAVSSSTAGVVAEDVGSQTGIDRVMSMTIYKNDLYIGTADSTGIGQVYKYDVGNTWSLVSSSTAGVIPTTGTGHNSGISGVTAMTVYNDDLWIGTEEASAAEVYSFNSVEGESNKLRFEAQSDNADGIQNALGNFGEIQFLAEENGRNVNGNMNTGVFSFSHGINTAVGAYDLAEDYPTRDDTLTPGDLVSLDIREKGFVRKAQGKNDRDIIGIYSVDPALRLSQKGPLIDGARAVPIALAGRVPVTVTLENGPIKIGDYLTSSLEPGKAAKANRPGRVVGRALGNYSGLEGEEPKVTVFLGLESIDWSDIQSAQKDVEELADSTAPADAGVVAEFVDTVNTAAEDLVFALLNKADNVSVVITNQFTALFASIQELFVRTLAILPGGSFIVPSGENQISGTATMPAGATDVLIPNEQVDEQSIVYISPTSAIDAPLYVARKVKGKGFHVRLKEPFNEDITFDWFFIKTYIPKNAQGNEVNTIINQATSTDPGESGTTTITIISPDAGGVSSQADTTPIDEVSSGDVESRGGTTTSEGEAGEDSESDTSEDTPDESVSDQPDQSNQDNNSNLNESGSNTGTAPETPVVTTPEPQAPAPTPSLDPAPSE